MPEGTQSRADPDADENAGTAPEVSVHETEPGKSVFVESGNTDGWIASDTTLDVTR